MGFFWGVEIKAEWDDGTPIKGEEYQKYSEDVLARKLVERGLICRIDDKEDTVIQYSPALVVVDEEVLEVLSRIVEITDAALDDLENEIKQRSIRKEE